MKKVNTITKKLHILAAITIFAAALFTSCKTKAKAPEFEPITLDIPTKQTEFFTIIHDPRTEIMGILGRTAQIEAYTSSYYGGDDSITDFYTKMFEKYKDHKAVKTMQALSKKHFTVTDFTNLAYHFKQDFSGFAVDISTKPESLTKRWQELETQEIYTFFEQIYDFIEVSNYQRIFLLKRANHVRSINSIAEIITKTNADKWLNNNFKPDANDKIIINSCPSTCGYCFYNQFTNDDGNKTKNITLFPECNYYACISNYILSNTYNFAQTFYNDIEQNLVSIIKARNKATMEEKSYKEWEKYFVPSILTLADSINFMFNLEFFKSEEYLEYAKNEEYPITYESVYSSFEKEISNQYFYDGVALLDKFFQNRDKYPTLDALKPEFIDLINSIEIPN